MPGWTCPDCQRRFARTKQSLECAPAMSFSLPRTIRHPKISRRPQPYGRLVYHVVNLRSPDDVDDNVRAWLTEAWAACE